MSDVGPDDLVVLNSGGPLMRVARMRADGRALCRWQIFNESHPCVRYCTLPVECLTLHSKALGRLEFDDDF